MTTFGTGSDGYPSCLDAMFTLLGARSVVAVPGQVTGPSDVAFFNQVQAEILFPGGTAAAEVQTTEAVEHLANLVAAATEIAYAAIELAMAGPESGDDGKRRAFVETLRVMTGNAPREPQG